MDDFSALSIFRIAPAGQTSEHFVHSGRQYPRSYDSVGCMNVSSDWEGRKTSFGHAETHSWQAVQCCCMLCALCDPGGVIGVWRLGAFFSMISAKPPSILIFSAFSITCA